MDVFRNPDEVIKEVEQNEELIEEQHHVERELKESPEGKEGDEDDDEDD